MEISLLSVVFPISVGLLRLSLFEAFYFFLDNLSAFKVAAPLGITDAVEGGVLGEAAESGFVGLGELFQRGFAVVGEGYGSGGLLVVGTRQLADVAAEDITAGVERRGQFGSTVLDGVVGGAATGIDLVSALPFPADNGMVRTGIDTTAAVATAVG